MSSLYPEIGEECYYHDLEGQVDKVTVIGVRTPIGSLMECLVEFYDGTRLWVPEFGVRRE